MGRLKIPWEDRLAAVPTDRDDIRQRVWELLKARLEQRRRLTPELGTRVDFGPPDDVNEHGQDRGPIPRDADLVMGLDCSELLADLAGIWPDAIPLDTRKVAYPRLLDEVYELVRIGVLRPDPGSSTRSMMITAHGAACLDADDPDLPPHSAERVAQLRARFPDAPDLDLLARHYGEAIATYRDSHDLSATVMIGACYELGLREMAEAIVQYRERSASPLPGVDEDAHKKTMKRLRKGKYVSAAKLTDFLAEVFVGSFKSKMGGDQSWLETCLSPHSFFVRRLRNEAGHPTGVPIDRDEVATYIQLFLKFYGRVRSIVATIDGLT